MIGRLKQLKKKELMCQKPALSTDRCDISLSGNVYQITEHKSLHGNVGITSPKRGENAYVCVCMCVFCARVCAPSVSVFVCCLATGDACAN